MSPVLFCGDFEGNIYTIQTLDNRNLPDKFYDWAIITNQSVILEQHGRASKAQLETMFMNFNFSIRIVGKRTSKDLS